MDVIINKDETHIPVEISTWGDLLSWVETDYLKVDKVTPVSIESGDFDRVFAPNAQIYGPEICDFPEYGIVPILEPWEEPVQRTREHIN
jgi:hypothetical protein